MEDDGAGAPGDVPFDECRYLVQDIVESFVAYYHLEDAPVFAFVRESRGVGFWYCDL